MGAVNFLGQEEGDNVAPQHTFIPFLFRAPRFSSREHSSLTLNTCVLGGIESTYGCRDGHVTQIRTYITVVSDWFRGGHMIPVEPMRHKETFHGKD